MATGAGKTRTVIALSDLLIRANWAKRILFLADRTALVNQAVERVQGVPARLVAGEPRDRAPRRGPGVRVDLPDDAEPDQRAEQQGERRFGPGYFDLVVIDEAHRSVFQKYRAIFDYFDSLLVGLTATPRDEVDRNTYNLFDLEPGVPTDDYGLDEAVADGFLVPLRAVSVPLKFAREGIRYDDLSDEEKDQWDELDWDEDGAAATDPGRRGGDQPVAVQRRHRRQGPRAPDDPRPQGRRRRPARQDDRLRREPTPRRVHRRALQRQLPALPGEFARVITHDTEYAQDLIDKFSIADRDPHIAISVDMLDTGIDVPEVVNLVFFKLVRSKTKFWQMIGRGTRLCPDLFGPGHDKEFFYVFDFCQNLEFFNQNPMVTDGALVPSLSARLFTSRLDLIATLDAAKTHPAERADIAELLRVEVAAMNVNNFVVRPHRRLVERFREPDAWGDLDAGELSELARHVAGLPAEVDAEPEEAKRFDLLLLSTELALLRTEPGFPRLQEQIRKIAGLLEEYPTIPAVARELALIADVQTDEWWVDVTLPMLESVRRRLRLLVPFIEKAKRKHRLHRLRGRDRRRHRGRRRRARRRGRLQRFRRKTRAFLTEHRANTVVEKIHRNWPITVDDIAELQRVLIDSGVGTADDVERAVEEAGSFGVFIRRLVGLDRMAAKEALAEFLDDKRYTANQIEFVNLVIDELTEHGVVEPRRFYESPFTDVSPHGPDALFESDDVDRLVAAVTEVRRRAEAA